MTTTLHPLISELTWNVDPADARLNGWHGVDIDTPSGDLVRLAAEMLLVGPLRWLHPAAGRGRSDRGSAGAVTAATQADPVGLVEIAARLGVAHNTVSQWRLRHPSFPEPRWVVSGNPAWDWPDVAGWARSTGRLPEATPA